MMSPLRILRVGGIALLVGLLLAMVLSLASARDRIGQISVDSPTGPIWFATGLEFDVLRLRGTMTDMLLKRATPEDVVLRYDILWSRLDTILKGETARKLDEYGVDGSLYRDLFEEVQTAEQMIVNLADPREDAASVTAFIEKLDSFSPRLRDASLQALDGSTAEAAAWRDLVARFNRSNSILLWLALGTLCLLLGTVILENLQTRRELAEKSRLLAKAEAASVAKSQFISIMNHELRTPLASVRGAVGLINAGAAGPLPEKAKAILQLAQRNCEQLGALIDDILDAERFAADKVELDLAPEDLNDLVGAEVATHAAMGESYGVTLDFVPAEGGPLYASVDRKRIRQVIANLVSNAVKFSDPGTRTEVRLSRLDGFARITVKDQGRGIPSDALPKIFDRFYQVDSSMRREKGGTGLGLSIVKQIVEAHGGWIRVESTEGEGTVFTVLVRLAEVVNGDTEKPDSSIAA